MFCPSRLHIPQSLKQIRGCKCILPERLYNISWPKLINMNYDNQTICMDLTSGICTHYKLLPICLAALVDSCNTKHQSTYLRHGLLWLLCFRWTQACTARQKSIVGRLNGFEGRSWQSSDIRASGSRRAEARSRWVDGP